MKIEKKRCTARGKLVKNTGTGAPTDEKLADGQLADHYVMCETERTDFVRPVRTSYVHVGIEGPRYPLIPVDAAYRAALTYPLPDEWIAYEAYPEDSPERPALGRYWSQKELDSVGKGCGAVTTMGRSIAETYATNPGYYGRTFCAACGDYFPVGRQGEFVWDGTDERVGT